MRLVMKSVLRENSEIYYWVISKKSDELKFLLDYFDIPIITK